MSAYLQMGNDSNNLVLGPSKISGFSGLILSPVNESQQDLTVGIKKLRENNSFDIIFDPQLYCPQFERGQLGSHAYFPEDLDTADYSSDGWWNKIINKLVEEVTLLEVDAVCSPAPLPKKYTADYYSKIVEIYSKMSGALNGSSIRPVMTVCAALKDLAQVEDALQIASIITTCSPNSVYLVIESEVEPRREISDPNMVNLMALVSLLEKSGCQTIVSHCSSDMILMKFAGASHCASGKFFNLRRFTRSRFDELQDEGGRQIAYWFENNLMGFLRRADLARIGQAGHAEFIGGENSSNKFSEEIINQFRSEPKKPWLALSWRQYLNWFAATENQLSETNAQTIVKSWLKDAEIRWKQISDEEILLDEERNNGSWIRPWRQFLGDFSKLPI